jgi:hypothetical protein
LVKFGIDLGFGAAAGALLPRFTDTFSALTPGASALPGGWAVACSTSNTTCRTSASTIATGIAADTARIESDGANVGALVEPGTTNLLVALVSSGLPNAGSGVSYPPLDTVPGPTGVAGTGERTTVSSAGYSKYANPSLTSSVGVTLTTWFRAASGSAVAQMNVNALATNHAASQTIGTTWTRFFRSTPDNYSLSGTGTIFIPVDARDMSAAGGTTAHAIDGYLAAMQAETLPGPTSLIGAGLTRAGTRLYNDLARFVRSGRMRLEIGLALLWDYTQIPAATTLLYIDTNNKILLTPTGSSSTPTGLTASITVDGSTYTCPTPIRGWRGDAIGFCVEWGAGVSSLYCRRNGGPALLVGQSAASFAALPSSGSLDLCCAGTASQLPAIVTYTRGW